MARSSSAAAASGSFMGSAALKPANRSGWLRTSSAISSLAARARSRATAGPPSSASGGTASVSTWT